MTTAQTYRYILLPMVFRVILPPLTSELLNTIKNTSVALTIGLMELTARARSMQEFSFQVFEAFTVATILYLITNMVVTLAMRKLEKSVAVPGYLGAPANAAAAAPATPPASGVTAGSVNGDPFTYFVQVGAFRSQAEADAQRAKLTMMGLDAKISERERAQSRSSRLQRRQVTNDALAALRRGDIINVTGRRGGLAVVLEAEAHQPQEHQILVALLVVVLVAQEQHLQ